MASHLKIKIFAIILKITKRELSKILLKSIFVTFTKKYIQSILKCKERKKEGNIFKVTHLHCNLKCDNRYEDQDRKIFSNINNLRKKFIHKVIQSHFINDF